MLIAGRLGGGRSHHSFSTYLYFSKSTTNKSNFPCGPSIHPGSFNHRFSASVQTCNHLLLQEEKVLLEQSNQNQIAEIVKLQKELEKFKSLETNLKKEKQKSKEQEKTIIKLEQELVDVRAELDKTQVSSLDFIGLAALRFIYTTLHLITKYLCYETLLCLLLNMGGIRDPLTVSEL